MKKIFSLLCVLALIMTSCNKGGFIISGNVENVEDGTKVYLKNQSETSIITVDSTVVKNGKFKIEGDKVDPILSYIGFGEGDMGFLFVLENGKIDVFYDKNDLEMSKASGTKNNDYLNTINEDTKAIDKKMIEFQQNNQAIFMEAQMNQNQKVIESISKQMQALANEKNDYFLSFAKNNPDSFISLLIIKDAFMNNGMEQKEAQELFNKASKEVQELKEGKELSKLLSEPVAVAVAVGDKAPEFSATNTEGKTISLKESLGKVTIIDFWASWCKPCREDNPNMVKLYNKFHDKGLNIIGVSLDKDADKWKKAIEDDKLAWNHVSSLKFWEEPIAIEYGVKFIPSVFILDENGIVIAKDLRGEELETKISSLLN